MQKKSMLQSSAWREGLGGPGGLATGLALPGGSDLGPQGVAVCGFFAAVFACKLHSLEVQKQ